MLGDLDYKLCETALMELFATHTYPPQISEIREKCAEYTVPHLKDQGEAWGEVQKAISQYGYYRQEEALESLTPIVREAVRRLGFREICLDENQDAVRAHFFKIYSTLIERKTNDAKLRFIQSDVCGRRYPYIREWKAPDEIETELCSRLEKKRWFIRRKAG